MEVKGTIKEIYNTQIKGKDKNFSIREMVLQTEGQYPQDLLIQFVQDKTELLDKFNIGDKVTVGINLKGRGWVNPEGETKYFNSIQGWKIFLDEGKELPPIKDSYNAKDISQHESFEVIDDDEKQDLTF